MRITVEDITTAFERTGLRPVRGTFSDRDDEGCGMQAYACAHEEFGGRPHLIAMKLVGGAYFDGWTSGWDYGPDGGLPNNRLITQYGGVDGMFRYLDGRADGAAAAEKMFARKPSEATALV